MNKTVCVGVALIKCQIFLAIFGGLVKGMDFARVSQDLDNKKIFSENGEISVDLKLWPGSACSRVCQTGSSRICYFQFTLEHYQVMGP